ncbi:DUF2061 domain-containing protein [Aurantimonas sp. Leaf443]|uniref:DUF2061 domain-containing protein n=1 Tax=Aurantimonas sp. Leaf443 TaxID=1736378 RepID=UPI0006FA0AF5|nr:DUF2061 domain-containing protein [Aurantimonas sp. Leaf443]KQT82213.1 hypothetical protein ASG48_16400 [Aurantimonas sp. Leaf443]
MESRRRSFAKALSWQALGLVSMSALGYLFTGSFASGGALALTSCAIGFLTYLVHERIWAGIGWGAPKDSRGRISDA